MIVFDLETTGLPLAEGADLDLQPRITEFGAIKLDHQLKEIAELEFLINPGIPLDPKVTKITGLTDDMLKDKLFQFPWPPEQICTVEVGETIWNKKRKLSDIYLEVTGNEHKGAHRSIADVRALIEIVKWYKKEEI